MPANITNGWTSGGLVPSYTTVAHILGSYGYPHTSSATAADALAPGSNIPPVIANPPGAGTPGAPMPKPAGTTGDASMAGLDPNVWGRLGEVAQRRILQAYKNSVPPQSGTALNTPGGISAALGPGPVSNLINPAAGTPETGGLSADVWAHLGRTVRSRLLNAIKNPLAPKPTTPQTAASVNPYDTSTNPFLYGGPSAGGLGWASTNPTGGFIPQFG